jgi:hypothetical protein
MSRIPRHARAIEPAESTSEPTDSTNEPADSTSEPEESTNEPDSFGGSRHGWRRMRRLVRRQKAKLPSEPGRHELREP